jgi:hypothetical protein
MVDNLEYEKSGCHECVHATSKHDWVDGKFTVIERTCGLNNTDKLYKWWEDNGTRKSGETFDTMECHEYHESTKALIEMNNLASKLLDELKKINKENDGI